jgi:hypothetical protein
MCTASELPKIEEFHEYQISNEKLEQKKMKKNMEVGSTILIIIKY